MTTGSSPERPPWRIHFGILVALGAVGLLAASALGTDHPHGLFSTGFLVGVVGCFWTGHALLSTLLVWRWGTGRWRVLGLHAGVLIGVPTLFGVVASIVS